MTPQDVINDVRDLLNDTDAVNYRYTDAMLLKHVNSAVKRTALLRPDLFGIFTNIACVVNTVIQSAPIDSIRIMEVMSIVGGNALVESDRVTMDQNIPTWRTDAAAAATTWLRHPRDPNKFFIYPQSPAQSLTIEYAQIPSDLVTLGATIVLTDAYKSTLTDCVVFLAQSIDDEHISSGRAKLFYDSFVQTLGVTAQQRTVTDTEEAGVQKGAPNGH